MTERNLRAPRNPLDRVMKKHGVYLSKFRGCGLKLSRVCEFSYSHARTTAPTAFEAGVVTGVLSRHGVSGEDLHDVAEFLLHMPVCDHPQESVRASLAFVDGPCPQCMQEVVTCEQCGGCPK